MNIQVVEIGGSEGGRLTDLALVVSASASGATHVQHQNNQHVGGARSRVKTSLHFLRPRMVSHAGG